MRLMATNYGIDYKLRVSCERCLAETKAQTTERLSS